MNTFLVAAGQSVFILVLLFWTFFAAVSLIEGQGRAFRRSLAILCFTMALNVFLCLLSRRMGAWGFGFVFVLASAAFLFFLLSPRPRQAIEIIGRPQRVDEQDTIFARFDLLAGSPEFREFYRRRPQYEEKDASIRKMPDILSASHQGKKTVLFSLASAEFGFLEHLLTRVKGDVASTDPPFSLSAPENSTRVKDIVRFLGADDCGIASLNPDYVYSHVGRGPEPLGSRIVLEHRFAVVFAVEMDIAMVAAAPDAPVIVETAKKYAEAARIAIILADCLRRLGHPARAHIAGSNYLAMLPPIAWEAGLGEMGRLGILITPNHGPRTRLGLVTTDFPMEADKPAVFGVQDFCSRCLKCARNCPAKAIPSGERTLENGVRRWVIDRERCYAFWRRAGTDCAICLAVCPYSHPANPLHRLIRRAAALSRPLQSGFIRADRFFYGEKPDRRSTGWLDRRRFRAS